MTKKIYFYSNLLAWTVVLFLITNYIFAWTTPTQDPPGGNIVLETGATPAGSTGYIQFNDASNLGADSNLFWDNTNKRLGIGTTSPARRLHINDPSGWVAGDPVGLRLSTTNYTTTPISEIAVSGAELNFSQDYTNSVWKTYLDIRVRSNSAALGVGSIMRFFTNSSVSGSSDTEKMRIDQAGNVGIGTTGPEAKLEVAGQIKITGGSPGANKVLTSDAAGLATWQTLGGIPQQIVTGTNPVCPSGWGAIARYWNSRTCASGTCTPTCTLIGGWFAWVGTDSFNTCTYRCGSTCGTNCTCTGKTSWTKVLCIEN